MTTGMSILEFLYQLHKYDCICCGEKAEEGQLCEECTKELLKPQFDSDGIMIVEEGDLP